MLKILTLLIFLPLLAIAETNVTVQVLGSGGPEITDQRASSAYIIWIEGESKILIDFGGGASLRFEQVSASIEELNVILLTHLHVDHTADLPALIKSSFFTNASGNLNIYGPEKNRLMPDTTEFINRLFQNNKGAWQYLGDNLDGSASLQLKAHNVTASSQIKTIYQQGNIAISAISVHHGPIPAIAYRIDIDNKSITFSGDMNGDYHNLEQLAADSNILVAHNAVPKGASGIAAALHMTPITIGKIAHTAKVKSLVLSHRMTRTLGREKETLAEIHKNYTGLVKFADDRSYYRVNN